MLRVALLYIERVFPQLGGVVARGAILSVGLVGLGTIVGYLTQIFMSRTLGASEFGTYTYVLGLLGIVRTVASLSLESAAQRFVGIYAAAGNKPGIQGFLRTSRRATVVVSLLGTAVCLALLYMMHDRLPAHLPMALLAGCILLLPTTLLVLEGAFLQALSRVYEYRIPFMFVRPLVIVGAVFAAVHYFGSAGSAVLALNANLAGVVIALAMSFFFTRSLIPASIPASTPSDQKRLWTIFCAANLGQNILYLVLSQQSDVVVVGSLIGTTNAGYYSAANQVSSLILLGVMTVNQYIAPRLAGHEVSRSDTRLPALVWRALLLNAAVSIPMTVATVVLGRFMLSLFGPSFVDAYPVLLVLSAGCVVSSLWANLWGDLLTLRGLYKESTVVIVVASVLNLALSLLLTPRYGMMGAAMATTTAMMVRGVMLAIIVNHKFGFWPWTVRRRAADS